ncbi:MAG: hypothetical protein ACOC80_00655 [Petrotogales bacterium]
MDIDEKQIVGSEDQIRQDRGLFENEDMIRLAEVYLEEEVPKEVKKTELFRFMWSIVGKKLQLTFLQSQDESFFKSLFQQAKILYNIKHPAYHYTYDDIVLMKQIELHFMAAIKSAIGTKENVVNERTMQNTQINQVVRSNTETFGSGKKGGIFGKLRGAF